MKEKILLSELTENCNGKKEKVLELLKAYDLAELGREVQRQQEKDIYNKVLAEHEFFADKDFVRAGINVGDRVLDESAIFILSDKDCGKVIALSHNLFVEQKICDEKGYYITNWDMIACDARNELVNYIIKEIIPTEFRKIFWEHRNSIIFQEKLIKITKDAFLKRSA